MENVNSDQAKLDEIRRQAAAAKVATPPAAKRRIREKVKEPMLAKILYVLAIASIMVGFALYKQQWSSDATAVTFLILGFVQGALFSSVGLALTYLKGIYENTRDS